MKRYISILLINISLMLLLATAINVSASIPGKNDVVNINLQEIDDAGDVSAIVTEDWLAGMGRAQFVHYKDMNKSINNNKGMKSNNIKASVCYKTFAKWANTPINYRINPNNNQGMTQDFITSAISMSTGTWDVVTSKNLFNQYTIDSYTRYGTFDGKNVIDFGPFSDNSAIAVTSIWYNLYTRQISEFDMRFNTGYTWGDATTQSNVMDLQNIATHELGHGVGLDDIYKSVCSSVTMYGYSTYGDVSKRSLEDADKLGLIKLYGN